MEDFLQGCGCHQLPSSLWEWTSVGGGVKGGLRTQQAFTSALILCSRNRFFFHRNVSYSMVPFLRSVTLPSWFFSRIGFRKKDLWGVNATIFKDRHVVKGFSRLKRRAWSNREEWEQYHFMHAYYVPDTVFCWHKVFNSDDCALKGCSYSQSKIRN